MAIAAGAMVLGAAPDASAAIAIPVQTGSIGLAYEYPSGSVAAGAAVDECGASDCREAVRVTNGCAAVAQAKNLAWGSPTSEPVTRSGLIHPAPHPVDDPMDPAHGDLPAATC